MDRQDSYILDHPQARARLTDMTHRLGKWTDEDWSFFKNLLREAGAQDERFFKTLTLGDLK